MKIHIRCEHCGEIIATFDTACDISAEWAEAPCGKKVCEDCCAECARQQGICDTAADMIEKLSDDRDTWQRRSEAAERDTRVTCPCEVCGKTCTYNKIDAYDTCDDFRWRGPCEENGGVNND